jgi:HSP20 family protein
MANITRRNGDYRDPLSLAREIFGFDPFVGLDWPAAGTRTMGQGTFSPSFEVVEREDGYVFSADVPGVQEKDLDITVQDGQLIISGARNAEERKEGENYYLYERRFGNFTRAFKLPDNADDGRVEASLDTGVLTVTIGKRESAKPRKIMFGQRKELGHKGQPQIQAQGQGQKGQPQAKS